MRTHEIANKRPELFVSCRVGLELNDYQEDLAKVLTDNNINDTANFIITPITSPRSTYYYSNYCDTQTDFQNNLELLPDLVLPTDTWDKQVAISIGQLPIYSKDSSNVISFFDKLFKHALYLPTPVVLLDCPETHMAQELIASIINKNLLENTTEKLILIRVPLVSSYETSPSGNCTSFNGEQSNVEPLVDNIISRQDDLEGKKMTIDLMIDDSNSDSGLGCNISHTSSSQETSDICLDSKPSSWNIWNDFRTLLNPDHRIGLCLTINNDLENDTDSLARWTGEPVRMIVLSVDRFSSRKGFRNTMRPAGWIKEFMRMIAIANSLKTSFVVQAKPDISVEEHLECLSTFCDMLNSEHQDNFRAWNDTLLSPLQPLSNNLDSYTYQIFENDIAKYSKYHEAMVESLSFLVKKRNNKTRFIIMVLGAGRGPLVDAMIGAIHKLNLWSTQFKIYALDKNYSSIRSLRYKNVHNWALFQPKIQVEIVEADMRVWDPNEKADIIATELLGSFSDNELSPECIDGSWKFATKDTLSIPQSYSSYVAPICSYKMRQELHKSRFFNCKSNIYDNLQVVRLSNYYMISEPQKLFRFDHKDLSQKPSVGANQREKTLIFRSKVDTVCHGFAGYFVAKLFGRVTISTVPTIKTPNMESWFPAFIPLERPVHLLAGSCLEVNFYRKDSEDKVWYEWIVQKPEISRLHSLDGYGTAMSKII